MRRTFTLAVVAVSTALLAQGTAAAHIQSLAVDRAATRAEGGVVVSGTIDCAVGERYRVTVQLMGQFDSGNGVTSGKPECDGPGTHWQVSVPGDFGSQARATVTGDSGVLGEGIHDTETTTRRVDIMAGTSA